MLIRSKTIAATAFPLIEVTEVNGNDNDRPQPPEGNRDDEDSSGESAPPELREEDNWIGDQLRRLQRYLLSDPIPKRILDLVRRAGGRKDKNAKGDDDEG